MAENDWDSSGVGSREIGAEQNHWTERGRATAVANSDATGRPRRSVLALGCETMTESPTTQHPNQAELIAPCGMNCALCRAFVRSRNRCPGCRGDDRGKPKTRVACRIKSCGSRRRVGGDFCIHCARFPCERLSCLDKRYRMKYGMSMIENLRIIKAEGLTGFVQGEKSKWTCPGCGATICVHESFCLVCKREWREDAAQ